LRANDHGAALAIITRMLLRSYFAFTPSGRLQIMRIGVGAEKVDVALYLSTSRSQSSASNLRCTMTVLPRAAAMPANPPGPEW